MSGEEVSSASPLRGQKETGSAPAGMPERRELTSLRVTLAAAPGTPPRVETVATDGLARDVLVHWALPLLARARRLLDRLGDPEQTTRLGPHSRASCDHLADDIAALIGHAVTNQPPADELAAVLADGTPARVTREMLRELSPEVRNSLTPEQLPEEPAAPVGHPQDIGPLEQRATATTGGETRYACDVKMVHYFGPPGTAAAGRFDANGHPPNCPAYREPLHVAKPAAVSLVFDRWPGGPDGPFIEAETDDGRSVTVGDWTEHDNGTVTLRLTADDLAGLEGLHVHMGAERKSREPTPRVETPSTGPGPRTQPLAWLEIVDGVAWSYQWHPGQQQWHARQLDTAPLGEATPAQLPANLAEPVCDCDAVKGGGHLLRCATWTR